MKLKILYPTLYSLSPPSTTNEVRAQVLVVEVVIVSLTPPMVPNTEEPVTPSINEVPYHIQ